MTLFLSLIASSLLSTIRTLFGLILEREFLHGFGSFGSLERGWTRSNVAIAVISRITLLDPSVMLVVDSSRFRTTIWPVSSFLTKGKHVTGLSFETAELTLYASGILSPTSNFSEATQWRRGSRLSLPSNLRQCLSKRVLPILVLDFHSYPDVAGGQDEYRVDVAART